MEQSTRLFSCVCVCVFFFWKLEVWKLWCIKSDFRHFQCWHMFGLSPYNSQAWAEPLSGLIWDLWRSGAVSYLLFITANCSDKKNAGGKIIRGGYGLFCSYLTCWLCELCWKTVKFLSKFNPYCNSFSLEWKFFLAAEFFFALVGDWAIK